MLENIFEIAPTHSYNYKGMAKVNADVKILNRLSPFLATANPQQT